MIARKRYLVALMLSAAVARADTTLVVEAAPAADGPWQVVPIGPEALDLKGGIVWPGWPELKFVRVRVVQPEPAAVSCACDACTGVDEREESQ